MALEAALVNGTGLVVAVLLVLAQLGCREQSMLMGEDFFVPST